MVRRVFGLRVVVTGAVVVELVVLLVYKQRYVLGTLCMRVHIPN